MNHINRLSHFCFIISLICSFVFIRSPDILSIPVLRFVLYFIFFVGCILGIISCFSLYKKLTMSLILFICSIVIHAIANFYQPSLRFGISFQNYVLQNTITSEFELTQTRLYMLFFICFLFPSISFFSSFFNNKLDKKYITALFISLVSCFLLNCFVAIYQGIVNLNFLAKGSGTSVEANRAPGLLDDSSVAGFLFAVIGTFLFAIITHDKVKNKAKIICFLFFILNLFAGIMNNSRAFFVGLFSAIFILIIIKIFQIIYRKKYKLLFILISISAAVIFIIDITLSFKSISGFSRLHSLMHVIQSNGNLFTRYALLDSQRATHLQIMWETIKENFYSGTGLGSYASNFYYYMDKLNIKSSIILDIPTNAYFSIISELGLSGLLLIVFCLFLFIYYIIKQKNNPIFFSNIYNLIIGRVFPIWSGIPFLILILVAYMFYFPAISYIACLIIAPCIVTFINSKKSYEKLASVFFFSLSVHLISVVAYLTFTAQPVPSFRWDKRGTPQVPMTIGSLPQPQGQTEKEKLYFSKLLDQILGGSGYLFKPDGASEGQWFKPKTDFLILQPEYRIYIGPDNRSFPVNIDITYYAKNGVSQKNTIIVSHASWIHFSIPKQKEFESCFHGVSSSLFCYYHVNVSPSWAPSFLKSIGFYIENKYINYQNLRR